MGQILSREDDEYQDQEQDQEQHPDQHQEQKQNQEQKQHQRQELSGPKRRHRNAAGAIRSRKTKTSAQGRTRRKTVAFD